MVTLCCTYIRAHGHIGHTQDPQSLERVSGLASLHSEMDAVNADASWMDDDGDGDELAE